MRTLATDPTVCPPGLAGVAAAGAGDAFCAFKLAVAAAKVCVIGFSADFGETGIEMATEKGARLFKVFGDHGSTSSEGKVKGESGGVTKPSEKESLSPPNPFLVHMCPLVI